MDRKIIQLAGASTSNGFKNHAVKPLLFGLCNDGAILTWDFVLHMWQEDKRMSRIPQPRIVPEEEIEISENQDSK